MHLRVAHTAALFFSEYVPVRAFLLCRQWLAMCLYILQSVAFCTQTLDALSRCTSLLLLSIEKTKLLHISLPLSKWTVLLHVPYGGPYCRGYMAEPPFGWRFVVRLYISVLKQCCHAAVIKGVPCAIGDQDVVEGRDMVFTFARLTTYLEWGRANGVTYCVG